MESGGGDYLSLEYYLEELTPYSIARQFVDEPKKKMYWPLIPAAPYIKAVNDYVRSVSHGQGDLLSFPHKYVYQWMGICMHNIALLAVMSQLFGHTEYFPSDDLAQAFAHDEEEEGQMTRMDYSEWYDYLESNGFYDWIEKSTPSGAYNISDYGIEPLFDIAREYKDGISAAQTLEIINRILDSSHYQGPFAYNFIEGGTKTLNKVSFGEE